MPPMISVAAVTKRYKSGLVALDAVDLEIAKGEIFALLGPNGAGKTTLIGVICGTVSMTAGRILIDGHNIVRNYRAARRIVGLVPQEIALDIFSTVLNSVSYSRRLFGRAADPAYIERLLRDLSLWDKRDTRIVELSGGMKRRTMIAKALSHEPDVLFLDEPTAGVDVNLRRDMWALVRRLRAEGVTVILTTHYIEEAEEMADRVGVINHGRIVLVEEKAALMRKLGKRRLTLALQEPLPALPKELAGWPLELEDGGRRLSYRFDASAEDTGVPTLLRRLGEIGVDFNDLDTTTTTLEDIFVDLVGRAAMKHSAAINLDGVFAIYRYELRRTQRTIWQSVATPVITTALYFVVFGAAIGSRISDSRRSQLRRVHRAWADHAVALTQSISNAAIGIYFPKFTGTIFELLSAPMSSSRPSRLCRRGGDQIGRHRAHHSGDGDPVRAGADRTSGLDDRLPDPDLGRVQPVRLHHRDLGENFEQLRSSRRSSSRR